MKIIISHDVDHLSVKEHLLNDLYLPKLFIRDIYHLLFSRISFGEYLLRLKEILNRNIWDQFVINSNLEFYSFLQSWEW